MSNWELILATTLNEFSDLSDLEEATRVTLRLLFAAMLGGILGFEREQQGKAAGLRTHMLVCLGSCLFVVAADLSGGMDDAMSRVVQGVIQGIGFLCAGTIIKGEHLSNVRGLTTAAGIWFTAAIGVAVGLGKEATALVSTGLALIVLHVLPLVFQRTDKSDH
ncbi:MgtC/SapB family protein [Halopseudomonas nanhaiensis]|uniref:MgtC/SapB family protein n=1 Tax=Halopseudomonas nanhaiensis TaxID=2830842 RepID=UPI001CBEF894|nr:MgtC/SapB family protein [Halopseudomonas nanhaiensis]UAW97755.1 MgtC/SapB family protein [Halopseudomonas nanhaiensis]